MENTIEKFEPKKDLIISSYKFHALGVEPLGNPTYEDWESAFEFAKKSEQSVQFWVGDLINQAERKWGDKYSQALDSTDYSLGALQNNKYVAANVDREIRHQDLSFEHHKAVASLSKENQIKWLDKASSEQLTIKELRKELKGTPKKEDSKKQSLIELEIAAKNFCESIGIDREDLGIVMNDGEPKLLRSGKFQKVEKEYFDFMFE